MKKGTEISAGPVDLKLLSDDKIISDHIINHSRSMISIINREYVYEKVNSTFCNAHQVAMDNVVGKSLGDVWGQDTFRDVIKENLDLCFGGKTIKYEAAFSTAGSGKRFFEVVFRPIMVKEGVITHLLAETFDINDLRQSELAALAKEEELRKFETNLPIGFLRCDPSGKIIHVNKAFLKIMDCKVESAITSRNLKNFYPDDSLFYLHLDQLNDNNVQTFGRVTLRNCSGKEIPCRLSGFMAMDETGNQSFIDFAVEDSSRELMLENRLLQAQKLETIGALAGGIAHDFNNILATISGYAEMLREDLPKDSDLSEKAGKIQGAVIKARSITNQILTFSRQVEQEKVPVRVSEVLSETIGFVRSAAPSNIVIKSRITGKKANVFADPTQLFRVFLNLMTNAVQSMEEGGGTLSVSMEIVEGKLIRHELNKDIVADEYVLLVFKDTGKGMEPSLISRVFEPFFTTREVGKGTGLGLSVVHGIITELEGEILVSSKKEKGSVFYVYLPVSKQYPDFSAKTDRKKKILFISGNKHESRILSLALQNSGYKLIYTSDKKSFIKVMSSDSERPDLIVYMSDSKLIKPADLIGVFEKMKTNTPCILINDPNQGLLEEKILNSGIVMQQLIKPVSLREIGNAIQSSLK
ncbi:MAG: PAS domain-containing protein [Bacteroidales bacterium]|nr:PAS domain-containing protein [Bacteroidales bacterium]